MTDTWENSRSSGQFVGSAVVVGALYGPHFTLLRLKTFTGECFDYRIEDVPDFRGAVEILSNSLRPLSVKIQQGGQRCSVVTLAAGGARARSVTLATALALHKSGIHAVVDGGLAIGLPCSVRNKPKDRAPLEVSS
jgi:hypothetical protein